MANYPETPVPQYPYENMELWRNMVSQFDDGREQRRRKGTFPTYDVTLTYNGLTRTDIDMLWNFYQDREGTFREFYFFTPFDESHKGLFVAVADGVKDTYDLPGIVAGATTVYVDGLPTAVTLLTGGGDEGADRCWFGQVLASGTIARDTLKISAADGVAFVDPSSDAVASAAFLAAVNNHDAIEITSKTDGKKMHGYIKAAGTGETLGANVLTNGDMESFTGWTQTRGALSAETTDKIEGAQSGKFTLTATTGSFYRQPAWSRDCLYAINGSIKNLTIGTMYIEVGPQHFGNRKRIFPLSVPPSTWTEFSGYYTPSTSSVFVSYGYGLSGNAWLTDNVTIKQVLTPSATGVTITSTADGSTYNWASKEDGFNYNDASGYSYSITTR